LYGLCIDLIFKSVQAGPQVVLLTVCFASALFNNNCLAFILTSYLKSVAAGPQRLQQTVKKAKREQSRGKKRLLRFLKNFYPLRPCFDVFKVPKRGRSGGTKKSKKIVIFVKAVTKTGASVWPGRVP
jgi:hypothetical protein